MIRQFPGFEFAVLALLLLVGSKEVWGYFHSPLSSSSWGSTATLMRQHPGQQNLFGHSRGSTLLTASTTSSISARGGAGVVQAGEDEIRSVIQTYLDSMLESSGEKVREAFHPNAKITGYLGPVGPDTFKELSVDDFIGILESASPSPKEQGEVLPSEILSIVVTGTTAVAMVRDDYGGMTFFDILSFVKVDNKWSIYNKVFHVEGPAS